MQTGWSILEKEENVTVGQKNKYGIILQCLTEIRFYDSLSLCQIYDFSLCVHKDNVGFFGGVKFGEGISDESNL